MSADVSNARSGYLAVATVGPLRILWWLWGIKGLNVGSGSDNEDKSLNEQDRTNPDERSRFLPEENNEEALKLRRQESSRLVVSSSSSSSSSKLQAMEGKLSWWISTVWKRSSKSKVLVEALTGLLLLQAVLLRLVERSKASLAGPCMAKEFMHNDGESFALHMIDFVSRSYEIIRSWFLQERGNRLALDSTSTCSCGFCRLCDALRIREQARHAIRLATKVEKVLSGTHISKQCADVADEESHKSDHVTDEPMVEHPNPASLRKIPFVNRSTDVSIHISELQH
jgi:hypothetical protein